MIGNRTWRWSAPLYLAATSCLFPSSVTAAIPPRRDPPADTRRFDIQEYRISGNSVLTEREIDVAVEPFLGPGKAVADIEGAVRALNRVYEQRGFQTVSAIVPVQQVVDGVIELKVVERKVGRLRVTGSRYFDLDVIKRGAPSVAEGVVPNLDRLQKDLVSLNQFPDRSVEPNLKQGRDPDTVDIDLVVRDKLPLHAALGVNNRQSPSTTPTRINGSLSYTNLWQRGDTASFTFQVAPERPSDALVFSGSYLYHVPGSPISIVGSYLHSNSKVSTLGSTTVIGRGDDAGLQAIIPLGTDSNFTHSAAVGIDYKRFFEADRFGAQTTLAPLTWYPVNAGYSAVWSSETSTTNLNASVAFTFAGLGSNNLAYQNKRYFASSNFIIARAALDHVETVWRKVDVSAHVTGQLTGQPLIQNEQFSLGGLDSVRGYLEGAALGDYGGAIQAEVRSPPLANLIGEEPNELRAFGFFDAGAASVYSPLPLQTHSYMLSSAGVGIRAKVFDVFTGEVIGAVPFANVNGTKARNPRILFNVSAGF